MQIITMLRNETPNVNAFYTKGSRFFSNLEACNFRIGRCYFPRSVNKNSLWLQKANLKPESLSGLRRLELVSGARFRKLLARLRNFHIFEYFPQYEKIWKKEVLKSTWNFGQSSIRYRWIHFRDQFVGISHRSTKILLFCIWIFFLNLRARNFRTDRVS